MGHLGLSCSTLQDSNWWRNCLRISLIFWQQNVILLRSLSTQKYTYSSCSRRMDLPISFGPVVYINTTCFHDDHKGKTWKLVLWFPRNRVLNYHLILLIPEFNSRKSCNKIMCLLVLYQLSFLSVKVLLGVFQMKKIKYILTLLHFPGLLSSMLLSCNADATAGLFRVDQ